MTFWGLSVDDTVGQKGEDKRKGLHDVGLAGN